MGLFLLAPAAFSGELPGLYFRLLDSGARQIQARLQRGAPGGLAELETQPGWRHFPSAVLVGAVLYAKDHPENPRRGDSAILQLALDVGDLLAAEQARGTYNTRLDHHRDTYMWLEAYGLLESKLGQGRRERLKNALMENLVRLAADVAKREGYPRYQSPFIGTSPNHYSLWSSTVYLAGKVFHNTAWEELGARVMHRFAAKEQTPDGYWGEHSDSGPTTNYDYLTATGVALYEEYSHDPAALEAMRRSTTFHEYFTWPNGMPIETVNDRNRYGYLSTWGHFGFSHFPDGRRYAEFLTDQYRQEPISLESLGRIAQDALYYHEGKTEPIPQDRPQYSYRMRVPAGVRKSGPWTVCVSGLISTQAPTN